MSPSSNLDPKKFWTLFNASPNAYVLLDPELTIVEANDTYLEITGREREEIVGQHVFDAFPGDPKASADPGTKDPNRRRLEDSYERVLSNGEEVSIALMPYVIPQQTSEGEVTHEKRYWSATLTPIVDEDGEVEFILHQPTDVTDLYEKGFYDEELSEEEELPEGIDVSREVPSSEGVSREGASEEQKRLEDEEATGESGVSKDGDEKEATPQQMREEIFSRAEAVQEALWASEAERERLRRLFDQAPGFMTFLRGPDHVFEMANDAYYQVVGDRDIIGKPVREALPEVEEQGFPELLDEVYETGEPYVGREVEVRLQQEPGEELKTVYLDFLYQPITGPEGDVNGIFVQGHDVTEKKRAKDRLHRQKDQLEKLNEDLEGKVEEVRRQRERLRSLLDSIPDEVWFCNGKGEVSLVNEAVIDEFGFAQAEDAYRPLEEVLVEQDLYKTDGIPRPVKEAPLFRSLNGKVVEGEEELLLRPETGEKRYRQVSSVPLRGPSGAVTGSVAVVRDITELKRTEKKLRRRERDFTALANNIPQLAWMAEPDGYIFWYNERWYEYTGTTLEEMEGWGWKKVHHPDYLDQVVEQYREAIETEEPFEDTFPLRRRDGEYRWFLTRAMPIRGEKGQVIRWFGTNTDITERLRLEEKLKEMNETLEEQVEERTRQVRELTSRVTMAEQRERERIARILHDDLQQKLFGIQLKMSSLQREALQEESSQGRRRPEEGHADGETGGQDPRPGGAKDDVSGQLEEVKERMEEAIQTTRRLSVGMSPPILGNEGLTAALQWLESHMEETKGLDVQLKADQEFRMEEEMRVLLFQITRELLSNVAEHADVHRAAVQVREEEGDLVIEVVDEGKGFDLETLEEIGSEEGFGLTAARERVRLFGGELTVNTAPGEGTHVTVRVPLNWNSRANFSKGDLGDFSSNVSEGSNEDGSHRSKEGS